MAEIMQNEETTVGKKLFEIFSEALNLYEVIESSVIPYNSIEFQEKVKKCIALFEDSTRLVSLIGMFSSNENVDEITTDDLQFLLLPYFLGQLVQKIQNDHETLLHASKAYFKDFLIRCEDYEIIKNERYKNTEVVAAENKNYQSTDSMKELLNAANKRNSKIEQYRKMKELEEQISALKLAAQNPNVDDEIKRKLYIQQLNHSIMKAQEELVSIDQELTMVEYRKNLAENSNNTKTHNNQAPISRNSHQHFHKPTTSLKPIIITKDVAQKAVFGMGYPSLPIMTVAEFYEQRVKEGIFPDEQKVKQMNANMLKHQTDEDTEEKEEVEKSKQEILVENDDDENLARLRAKDEYKDVVRRGDGNRHNRS